MPPKSKKPVLLISFRHLAILALIIVLMVYLNHLTQSQRLQNPPKSSFSPVKFTSLQATQKQISFKIHIPELKLQNERVAEIKAGGQRISDNPETYNSLWIHYQEGTTWFYTINISTQIIPNPTNPEKIEYNPTSTYFYQNLCTKEGECTAPDLASNTDPSTNLPGYQSFLYWFKDGIRFEIREYVGLTRQNLIDLANSFSKL